MNKKSGFTLLELILVMAIISLMAGFGISRFPGVQKGSRDTQRRSDLKQYQTALESYANRKGGFYPSRTAQTPASDKSAVTPNLCADLGMTQCPADPKTGQSVCAGTGTCDYYYISNGTNTGMGTASTFVLYSRLEKQVNDSNVLFIICSNGKTGTRVIPWTPSSTCPL